MARSSASRSWARRRLPDGLREQVLDRLRVESPEAVRELDVQEAVGVRGTGVAHSPDRRGDSRSVASAPEFVEGLQGVVQRLDGHDLQVVADPSPGQILLAGGHQEELRARRFGRQRLVVDAADGPDPAEAVDGARDGHRDAVGDVAGGQDVEHGQA